VVGRTGRYKIFPVVGTAVITLGMFLLSRIGAATPYWQLAVAMLVLGIGIGMSMQILTIVVQSTVAYQDLGVATSGVTFFRTLAAPSAPPCSGRSTRMSSTTGCPQRSPLHQESTQPR
jgi:hypothetical protein